MDIEVRSPEGEGDLTQNTKLNAIREQLWFIFEDQTAEV